MGSLDGPGKLGLTKCGQLFLRKVFMSPPDLNSSRIRLEAVQKLSPTQRTMF